MLKYLKLAFALWRMRRLHRFIERQANRNATGEPGNERVPLAFPEQLRLETYCRHLGHNYVTEVESILTLGGRILVRPCKRCGYKKVVRGWLADPALR